jgi:hypothetical protein
MEAAKKHRSFFAIKKNNRIVCTVRSQKGLHFIYADTLQAKLSIVFKLKKYPYLFFKKKNRFEVV